MLLGVLAGASAWISAGVLAVTDPDAVRRIGALPALPWLAAGAALGAAAAWGLRLRAAQAWPLALLGLLWLPWLPLRVPPAFLLWEGPLEGLVWAAAIAGVAWAAWPWRASSWPPARGPILAFALGLAAYLSGAWALADATPAGDEPHYLIITQSLLADGDLRIENNHRQGDYTAYFEGELRPDFLRRGVDGQIYSVHAPGLSALVLPAFAAFGHPGVVVFLALLAAAGGAATWAAAFRLTGSAAAAWAAWGSLALSTPIFFHAFTVYPDGAGAAITALGVLALVTLETGGTLGAPALVALGAALGLLPWLHTRFAIVAGVLGAALVLRLVPRPGGLGRAASLLAVPLLSAAGWFWSFYAIYGSADPTAPYGRYTQSTLANLRPGLPGLLFDQQFGLIANAPVYLAAVVGLGALWQRSRRLAIELGVLLVPYVAAVAAYRMWWGGYSAPGRFAVAVLWPLALPLAAGWARWPGAFRAAMAGLGALGVAVTGARAFGRDGALLYNGRDGVDLLLDAASRSVDLSLAFPSLHRDPPATAVADIATWLVVAALAAGLLHLAARRSPSRGAAWARAAGIGVLALMGGATVTWAGRPHPPLTASISQMSFLERWTPAAQPVTVQVMPPRSLRAGDVAGRLRLGSLERLARQDQPPLLIVPRVPAGDYELVVEGASRLDGTLLVGLGRTTEPFLRLRLSERRAGLTGFVLRLPTMVPSVTVQGDDAARRTARRVLLHPLRVSTSDDRHEVAVRAEAQGNGQLFFLDENVWVEPGGFWLRGRSTARIVAQPADPANGAVVLALRAGAVPNRVTLSAGEWRHEEQLAAGEEREVRLPPGALAPAVIDLAAEDGFRPHEVDPGNGDVRLLGAWVTPR